MQEAAQLGAVSPEPEGARGLLQGLLARIASCAKGFVDCQIMSVTLAVDGNRVGAGLENFAQFRFALAQLPMDLFARRDRRLALRHLAEKLAMSDLQRHDAPRDLPSSTRARHRVVMCDGGRSHNCQPIVAEMGICRRP